MYRSIKTGLLAGFLLTAILLCAFRKKETVQVVDNGLLKISLVNSGKALWEYTLLKSGQTFCFRAPEFEIDSKTVEAKLSSFHVAKQPVVLKNGVKEYTVEGTLVAVSDMRLKATFQVSDNNPIVRFRYELISESDHQLTKSRGHDHISYLGVSLKGFSKVKEIRLSEFNEMVHSFCLSERNVEEKHFAESIRLMGPLMAASDGSASLIVGYEHGSQAPDHFLEFGLSPDHLMTLQAVKGNYYNGYSIHRDHPFQTIWLEAGAVNGNEDLLAKNYRSFVLHTMSQNAESRKPYIFYNTWNFQERNRNWYKKPYLADMTLERMLQEIEVAHKMGIEVFVIDAGWFEKTGDWTPSLQRFPDGLKTVSQKLKDNGMKLGLWFNPTVAAKTSNMLKDHRDKVRTRDGNEGDPWPVWETEASYGMCLVSDYRDAFADKLISLNKELGVTYFKWDAIGQYECNDPRHEHGTEANSPQERMESYAFEISQAMTYVVDKLTKACPEAIVDFDVTEGGRAVGLGFLSAGKYFLINNGPYFFNYDIPFDKENGQWNIFFYPGPARTWICRTPLTYDKWIPTSLFLTHYLPDDPYENQSIAVGSLILGQNGIWGDLPKISKEGVDFFAKTLGLYKQVRDDMTESAMIRDGAVGGSPEVYEKINPETGKGAIVLFSSHTGSYSYISQNKVHPSHWETRDTQVKILPSGQVKIDAKFNTAEAKIIFFGIE
ncbi:MAG: alpha-galactosidase [Bacteroidales bacterium]